MRLRKRDESIWDYIRHGSLTDFLSQDVQPGVHSIAYRGQHLDILVQDRGSPVTLVYFHGAVPGNVDTYPVFSGRNLSQKTGVNLVAVSDPSLGMGNVSLGWHLGNARIGPLRPAMSEIIHHAVDSLNTKRLIFFGASGGAHPAVHYSLGFNDNIILLVNPRLSLVRQPWPSTAQYLRTCHYQDGPKRPNAEEMTCLDRFGPLDVGTIIDRLGPRKILLYHNLGDQRFLNGQTTPFLEQNINNPDLMVRLADDGAGHKVIPAQTIQDIIKKLAQRSKIDHCAKKAKFEAPSEALKKINSFYH